MMFELRLPSKECDLGPSVEYLGWKLQLGGHRCLRLQGKGGKNMETHGIDGGIMAESCVFRCFNLRAIDDVQPCLASKLCGIWWNHQLFMALVSEKRHNKSWHVTGDQICFQPSCLLGGLSFIIQILQQTCHLNQLNQLSRWEIQKFSSFHPAKGTFTENTILNSSMMK